MKQTTRYPWEGHVALTLTQARPSRFALNLRIPGCARNQPVPSDLYRYDDDVQPLVKLSVNGKAQALRTEKGFARIERKWKAGDQVTLELEMPVRRVVAHPLVKANRDRFALERGPLVFCGEGADNGGAVLERVLPGKLRLQSQWSPDVLGGVITVTASSKEASVKCIPYYAWCHRGPNEMRVWFPTKTEVKLASHCREMDSVEAEQPRFSAGILEWKSE